MYDKIHYKLKKKKREMYKTLLAILERDSAHLVGGMILF